MHSKSGPRRHHSPKVKAEVLAACDEPGASISGVALAHGLNTNLVRKWRSGRGIELAGLRVEPWAASVAPLRPTPIASPLLGARAGFVAIEMPTVSKMTARAATARADATPASDTAPIHVELRRGPLHLSVRWPISAARDCTAWLHELTTGLIK